MVASVYLDLVRAYAGDGKHALSLRQRNLIVEIAQLIDGQNAGGVIHYVAQSVGGTANLAIVNTGNNLTTVNQFSTLIWQPTVANTDRYYIQLDSLAAAIEVKSPQSVVLAANSLLPERFYRGIFLGNPVNEIRLMDF